MADALKRALETASSICLTTTELDGDAVGAIVALTEIIRHKFPNTRVHVVAHESLPARYKTIVPQGHQFDVAATTEATPVDLSLVVDGDPHRLKSATPHFLAGRTRAMIDHHRSSNPLDVDVCFHDPTAASTTEMILRLVDAFEVELYPDLAAALYAGLVFDTSIFRYRMTQPKTLRAAARLMETGFDHAAIVEDVLLEQSVAKVRLKGQMLGRMVCDFEKGYAYSFLTESEAGVSDTGGLVDELVFVEGITVGLLFVERPDSIVKVSIRSRDDIDISHLASMLALRGGGHARAAGATIDGGLAQVLEPALAKVEKFMRGRVHSRLTS